MNMWVLTIIFFLLTVGTAIGGMVALKKDMFTDVKNQSDCTNAKLCKNDPKCCVIWDNNICRKGKYEQWACVTRGDPVPLILFGTSVVSLIFFIIFLIMAIKG